MGLACDIKLADVALLLYASVVNVEVFGLFDLGSCDDKFLLLDNDVFCGGVLVGFGDGFLVKDWYGVGGCAARWDSIHLDVL